MTKLINWLTHVVALIMVSLLVVGCSKQAPEEMENTLIRPAKIAQVLAPNGDNVKSFPATVEPTYDAQLAFRVNGEVAERLVVAGQHVNKDQVLARLDDKDFQIRVKQAQAKYDLTLSQFNRSTKLFKEKLIAQSVLDQAKAQLDIDEAQLDAAKTNLKYTILTAPFEGIIAQLHVEPFEFIQAKQPIMELQGRDLVDVAIQVPEELMAKIPKDAESSSYQPILKIDALGNREFKVSPKEHDITPNPATKAYKVVFTMIPPDDVNVLAGMTGTLYVEIDQVLGVKTDHLLVPIGAVFLPNKFAGQDKHFVYKLQADNTTHLVEVTLIKMTQQGALVAPIEGVLKLGDTVIAAGSHLLDDGQKVKPWSRERGL
mgnify:CR=1 FL=1